MSNMYRILGIEFTPARLDATHPFSKGRTGFEIGRDSFYKKDKVPPTFASMIRDMGIGEDSEAEYDMKDLLRVGDSETIDFVQDFITGWSHSKDLKEKANQTLGQFSYIADYLKSHNRQVEFLSSDLLNALGDEDITLYTDSRNFSLRKVLELGAVNVVKDGNIFFGGNAFAFSLPPSLVYSDEICRIITKFFGKINDSMYVSVAQVMQEESFSKKINQIRNHVSESCKSRFTDPSEMPNFFDKK